MSKQLFAATNYPDYLSRLSTKLTDNLFKKSFLDFDFVFQDLSKQMNSIFDRWETYQHDNFKTIVNHPVDIWRDGNVTNIEIALAGFTKDDIEITDSEDGDYRTLTVSGKVKEQDSNENKVYTSKQISNREFKKVFSLTKDSIIYSASYKDGVLSIKITEPPADEPEVTTKSVKINID